MAILILDSTVVPYNLTYQMCRHAIKTGITPILDHLLLQCRRIITVYRYSNTRVMLNIISK